MDAAAHHLTAIYTLLACVMVPVVLVSLWRYIARRQKRQAEEAMRRGNQLHRQWLETSKHVIDRPTEN